MALPTKLATSSTIVTATTGLVLLLTPGLEAQSPEPGAGLVTQRSNADFATTLARVEPAVKARGLFVMRVMDHAAAAAQFGRWLAPNTVVLFGNPEVGSQVMTCAPGAGIDLPQKLQLYQQDGAVMVAYNDPDHLKRRHAITGCDAILAQVAENLAAVAERVANGDNGEP
jgi:uncharacterized protein (DUF302 family)